MSHFKDFMWADGWSATRERPVVKIPINEGQRNMTWTASGPYLPATQPVDWNCIPSALGHGSVLNVSAGILPSPRILAQARECTSRSPSCTYIARSLEMLFVIKSLLFVIKSFKVELELRALSSLFHSARKTSKHMLIILFSNRVGIMRTTPFKACNDSSGVLFKSWFYVIYWLDFVC